ncbi:E3 ubiquitin-protein ligase CCNB1IP1-like [Patella vulgata]|uniref:E3 ubiquitin-protein ligase CCNB1IP1-like n=1 Tax=Patella vulgata TaxID=6465 RepID=UPI00217FEBAA|nr:E3 ubiquitin-protein ligase CCNB1IP1-like [Patella vulgata]
MDSLICNFPKCRKELEAFAWVTSCSHIFCDDDGSRQFSKAFKCPACDTIVSGRFDIIRVDLKPSEQYKSMVLAGLKPETVMEICTRSLSFWTYQTQQEKSYQEYVSSKAKERAIQLEQYYEQIVTRTHAELNTLKSQIGTAKKELEVAKKKYNEVTEKLQEKSRQNQKLQSLYDALRRRCITPCLGNRDQPSDNSKHLPTNYNIPLSLTTVEG